MVESGKVAQHKTISKLGKQLSTFGGNIGKLVGLDNQNGEEMP